MRSKDFKHNEALRYICKTTGLKHHEIAKLIGCNRISVRNWYNNSYKMKQEAFDTLLEELPDYLEVEIEIHERSVAALTNLRNEVISRLHSNPASKSSLINPLSSESL